MTDRVPTSIPTSIPGPDPLDTATQWLNLHSDCDIECKQNHRVNHSTVSGLHAAAATARIAASEYKRERDEAHRRLNAVPTLEVARSLRRLVSSGALAVDTASLVSVLADRLDPQDSS